jgi:hypothetical protein
MKNRTTISISLLVFVVLLPAAVAADEGVPLSLSWEAGYVGACLAESGLSLSDETPLAELEARPSSGVSYDDGVDTKNPMVALLLSCVVPGWGEIYVGETTRGRWFMAAEAGIWAGYGVFRIQEGMREDDYREYAQIFAGTDAGAGSGYLSDMGGYIRSEGDDSYNESIRREARSLFRPLLRVPGSPAHRFGGGEECLLRDGPGGTQPGPFRGRQRVDGQAAQCRYPRRAGRTSLRGSADPWRRGRRQSDARGVVLTRAFSFCSC